MANRKDPLKFAKTEYILELMQANLNIIEKLTFENIGFESELQRREKK